MLCVHYKFLIKCMVKFYGIYQHIKIYRLLNICNLRTKSVYLLVIEGILQLGSLFIQLATLLGWFSTWRSQVVVNLDVISNPVANSPLWLLLSHGMSWVADFCVDQKANTLVVDQIWRGKLTKMVQNDNVEMNVKLALFVIIGLK